LLSLIISGVTFAWAYMNYRKLKTEKTPEHHISIFSYKMEAVLYCLSWFVMAFLSAFLIGIYYNIDNERIVL
jgi:hypothetical protein